MSRNSPEQLREILETVRTIALVGASDKPHRPSHEVMAYLQGRGYRVIPVNPRLAGKTLLGETVYADLASVPGTSDMADLFLARNQTDPVIDTAIEKGIPVVWMQIGVINEEAAQRALDAGLDVAMNVCPAEEIPRLQILVPSNDQ